MAGNNKVNTKCWQRWAGSVSEKSEMVGGAGKGSDCQWATGNFQQREHCARTSVNDGRRGWGYLTGGAAASCHRRGPPCARSSWKSPRSCGPRGGHIVALGVATAAPSGLQGGPLLRLVCHRWLHRTAAGHPAPLLYLLGSAMNCRGESLLFLGSMVVLLLLGWIRSLKHAMGVPLAMSSPWSTICYCFSKIGFGAKVR